MKFSQRGILLATAAGLTLTAGAAAAQQATDEVVVTGRRPIAESEAAALKVQRDSNNLVTVVAADSIGQLPDQNIAFAVGRLPGVALERDQGQARYVNLRGARPNWTTLSFDGLSVVSPEGRQSRFDNIPSAIASQVVVTKAVTPDMPGDTVAGNVDIRTRRAFDYKGLNVSGNLGIGYVTLGGGEENDASLVVSNVFLGGKLGVLLQGSHYRRNMVTTNWETDPYQTAGNTVDRRPGYEDRRWAREFEHKFYRLTRANTSFSARADYKIDDNNTVFASSIYTLYSDEELRSNYIFRMDGSATATGTAACPTTPVAQTTTGYADICSGGATGLNTPYRGTVYGSNVTANFNSLESEEYTLTNTVGGEHSWNGWDASWRLNFTQTNDGIDAPGRSNFQATSTVTDRPTVEYDLFDNDDNRVRLYRTVLTGTTRSRGARVYSIDEFPLVATTTPISRTKGGDLTQAYTAKFDVKREGSLFGFTTDYKFGGFWSTRSKKHNEALWSASTAQIAAAGLPAFTFETIALNNKSYLGNDDPSFTFRYFSKQSLDNYAAGLVQSGVAVRQNTTSNYFDVSEDIAAAYGMATVDQPWGNVVFGLRAERTENTGKAFGTVAGANKLLEVQNDETLFFPSVHVNWNITDEVKARFGVTTGASRPDYDDLRPNFTFNDSTQTVSGGNPFAKSEKAVGVDAYLEWYRKDGGYFAAGVYYKDLKDVLFTQAGLLGTDVLNSPGFDRSGYTLTTLRNGGDGYIAGLELVANQSFQPVVDHYGLPDWLGGFGVQSNVSLNDSEANIPTVGGVPARTIVLPGTSDLVYNVSLYFEKYGLSARLAYQYRTEWMQSVGDYQVLNGKTVPVTNGDVFWDSDEEMDLSVRYQLSENLVWYFDGANLTNSPARRYGATADRPIERESFGQRYITGIRWSF